MSRYGRKKHPFYRMVVADKEKPRDGRYLELIGTVDPLTDPATIKINEDRIKHWVGVGARPSKTAAEIIDKVIPGYLKDLETKKREKIKAARAKRKNN
jgi:small subunit ribosomal protein S16